MGRMRMAVPHTPSQGAVRTGAGVHTKHPAQPWHIRPLPLPRLHAGSWHWPPLPTRFMCASHWRRLSVSNFVNREQTCTSATSFPVTLYCEQWLSPSQGLTQVSLSLAASTGPQDSGVDWSQAISPISGEQTEPFCSPTPPPSPTCQKVLHYNLTRAEKEQGSLSGPAHRSLLASLGSIAVGSCCDAAIDKGLKALALVISLLCDLEQASLPLFRSFIWDSVSIFWEKSCCLFQFFLFETNYNIHTEMDKCKCITQELAYFL